MTVRFRIYSSIRASENGSTVQSVLIEFGAFDVL